MLKRLEENDYYYEYNVCEEKLIKPNNGKKILKSNDYITIKYNVYTYNKNTSFREPKFKHVKRGMIIYVDVTGKTLDERNNIIDNMKEKEILDLIEKELELLKYKKRLNRL